LILKVFSPQLRRLKIIFLLKKKLLFHNRVFYLLNVAMNELRSIIKILYPERGWKLYGFFVTTYEKNSFQNDYEKFGNFTCKRDSAECKKSYIISGFNILMIELKIIML